MWVRFPTWHNMASQRRAIQKERSSRRGTMRRNTKSPKTNAFWNSTLRMTSPSCVRRVSYFVGILWITETWIFSSSLAPSLQHVWRCCASGSWSPRPSVWFPKAEGTAVTGITARRRWCGSYIWNRRTGVQ